MDRSSTTRYSRRNFVAMLIDAIGWPLGQSFLSAQTILPMFVARLSGSNSAVGLINGIQSLGLLVPQLLAANRVEHLAVKKRYLLAMGLLAERLPILILAISAFLVADPAVLLTIFFVCWSVISLGTGLNLPAYMGLFAKAIPENRRGRIMGLGNAIGTLLATGGAYVARHFLQSKEGLSGYGWCFAFGFVILVLSILPIGFVDEGHSELSSKRRSFAEYLAEIPAIMRANRPFVNYILMQASLQLPLAGVAFLTSYAILNLRVSEPTVALCTAIYMAASTIGSLLWGLLGDSHGYRHVFIAGSLFGAAGYLIMALLPPVSLVYVAFVASGLFASSLWVGGNMCLEFCDESKVATYSAVSFTCTMPFRVSFPVVAGWFADRYGLSPVFAVIVVSSLIAFYIAMARVSDPRQTRLSSLPVTLESPAPASTDLD